MVSLFLQVLMLFFLKTGTPAFGEISDPLRSFNLHPLYTAFLQTLPVSAQVLPSSNFETGVLQSYGNNFFLAPSKDDESIIVVDLDSETSMTGFYLRGGLGRGFEAGLMLQTVFYYGGFLDPVISSFHELLRVPNGGREYRENGQVTFYLVDDTGTVLNESGEQPFALAASGELRYCVLQHRDPQGNTWMGSLGVSGKVPIAGSDHPLNEGGFDWGVRGILSHRRERVAFDASLGLAGLTRPEYLLPQNFQLLVVPFFFSCAWKWSERTACIATVQGSTSPFKLEYDRADRFSAVINLGGRIRAGKAVFLAFGFSEEFFTFAATDIGFFLEGTMDFGSDRGSP